MSTRLPRRRAVLAAVALLVCAAVLTSLVVGGGLVDTDPDDARRDPSTVRLVPVGPDETSRLWPFTSRRQTFDSLTLPVNVVVEGHPERVRALLVTGGDARWDEERDEWRNVIPEETDRTDRQRWAEARGAKRFVYADTPGPGGRWMDETYQLHDGTYFGSRLHLRLYGAPRGGGQWTAIQAHRDHWDWFRLRHTVSGLKGPQYEVERSLMHRRPVDEVARERFANGGIMDADGWVTVIQLEDRRRVAGPSPAAVDGDEPRATDGSSAPTAGPTGETDAGAGVPAPTPRLPTLLLAAGPLLGAVAYAGHRGREVATTSDGSLGGRVAAAYERLRWSRLADRRVHLLVAFGLALALLPPGVRAASLALETRLPDHPKVVAGLLYPVFAFGPPTLAFFVPRELDAETWLVVAFVGYGVGLTVDLMSIDVAVLPLDVVVHRFLVLVAVGLLAAVGQARHEAERPLVRVQVAAATIWLSLLAWPLFGLT
jgi:hypothetical protein